MRLKYSQTGDALYIYLIDGGRPVKGEEIDNGTLVDLDDEGRVVGIEVLNPARNWPLEEIAERFALDMDDVLALRALWRSPEAEVRDSRFPFNRGLTRTAR
jgi:uncharacterized protein YuzE